MFDGNDKIQARQLLGEACDSLGGATNPDGTIDVVRAPLHGRDVYVPWYWKELPKVPYFQDGQVSRTPRYEFIISDPAFRRLCESL